MTHPTGSGTAKSHQHSATSRYLLMNDEIASLQNPRVKAAARLRRRRGRKQADRILIDGLREVGRALEAGAAVEELFLCREMLETDEPASQDTSGSGRLKLLEDARRSGSQVICVTDAVFGKIGYGQRTDGVVAVARRPSSDLDRLSIPDAALVAVFEGVEKPGNLGAILRTADAAGVEAVIAVEPGVDVYGPNVIRASLGVVFCVPLVEASGDQARAWLHERGFRLVAATPEGDVPYT